MASPSGQCAVAPSLPSQARLMLPEGAFALSNLSTNPAPTSPTMSPAVCTPSGAPGTEWRTMVCPWAPLRRPLVRHETDHSLCSTPAVSNSPTKRKPREAAPAIPLATSKAYWPSPTGSAWPSARVGSTPTASASPTKRRPREAPISLNLNFFQPSATATQGTYSGSPTAASLAAAAQRAGLFAPSPKAANQGAPVWNFPSPGQSPAGFSLRSPFAADVPPIARERSDSDYFGMPSPTSGLTLDDARFIDSPVRSRPPTPAMADAGCVGRNGYPQRPLGCIADTFFQHQNANAVVVPGMRSKVDKKECEETRATCTVASSSEGEEVSGEECEGWHEPEEALVAGGA
eukprot:TRINITY_DN18651_c0_g2_i1.p1 TRINITY_DN18651_c0_g2~~TRINITY_DN18651_c0_g2_i1.p1  ORF type:complete len:346 (+),score=55.63 TRINITY_DN18651_c0_g2_i1:98-1135(+)